MSLWTQIKAVFSRDVPPEPSKPKPWDDHTRTPEDRAAWLLARPHSLCKGKKD